LLFGRDVFLPERDDTESHSRHKDDCNPVAHIPGKYIFVCHEKLTPDPATASGGSLSRLVAYVKQNKSEKYLLTG
jgi:hypothetical protein